MVVSLNEHKFCNNFFLQGLKKPKPPPSVPSVPVLPKPPPKVLNSAWFYLTQYKVK
jgi:hypothetical protein